MSAITLRYWSTANKCIYVWCILSGPVILIHKSVRYADCSSNMKPRRSYSLFGMILPAFFSNPIMEITSIFSDIFIVGIHSFQPAAVIHSFIQSTHCLWHSFLHSLDIQSLLFIPECWHSFLLSVDILPLLFIPHSCIQPTFCLWHQCLHSCCYWHSFRQSIDPLPLAFYYFFSQLIALWFRTFFHATYACVTFIL